jgi:uncharacterized oxidoreductase
MKLSSRTVLITGGTSGIGLGLAQAFQKVHGKVIVCGRNRDMLARVKEKYPDIVAIPCDVGDSEQRKKLAVEVISRFPEVEILVNNAGIQRYIDLKKGYDELKSGEDEIAVNFVGLVELTGLFINHLMKKPAAAIMNVSSGLAFMPMPNMPIYCATKAAVHTYTLILRRQLRDTSVKVFEIVPAMVDTDLNRKGREAVPSNYRGISVAEYIPSVLKGLESDIETIFYGDRANVMFEVRSESEGRRLNQPS